MASKTKKPGAGGAGKVTVIEESDEEMRSLANSLGRGLALAAEARELVEKTGKKPSKQTVRKLQAITEGVASAAPPPLTDKWED
jgi:hypothetical protein